MKEKKNSQTSFRHGQTDREELREHCHRIRNVHDLVVADDLREEVPGFTIPGSVVIGLG